ncbi:hypothetical protein EB796_004605 [Bugula neritina]|uniref:GTP cyclohydrolase 1 n=1 Tax=Bugula neritina TaxID=10212 RepID=A0A7J7KEL5_BUGNE|nr:hypothetical protein EB796_004605 [Bugula neritina]
MDREDVEEDAHERRRSIVGKEQHDRLADMSNAVRCMLKSVGENPDREGLLKTPERAAKAFMFFTKGYEDSISVSSGECNDTDW